MGVAPFFLIDRHRAVIGAFRTGFDAAARLHRSVKVKRMAKGAMPLLGLFASLP